ncbi:MAG: DUF1549 and DUF1553 domain-containing protein, partial [Planctomycetota bacterium]|nr:DUF1549 and DUF1553 domain-containing protein [Planctomycetota bacterium]
MRVSWLLFGLCAMASAVPAQGQGVFRGPDAEVVGKINEYIRQSWSDNEVKPSAVASDEEWLRRVTLDLVGHVPSVEDIEVFTKEPPKTDAERLGRRAAIVERLLADPAYVRHWTTVWTNLAIGQQTPDRTSRLGMQRFFREAFAKDRPWNEVVYDLLTAKGHFEENGAVNFLLAQIPEEGRRDDKVLATAKSTRLLLGVQVQCTQCHNHPFNDWKQEQFWSFNSFFQTVARKDYDKYNPQTGRMDDDYSELVSTDADGPVFFEKRSGLMQVAYPEYNGEKIEASAGTDRREALAKLVTQSDDRQLAKAFVNRTWGHFFGFGFTRPVDDMGPHNPPSHPELLDFLAGKFAENGYDVKKLMRWVVLSEPYQLTSETTADNSFDDPAAGETPLFSHMYLKRMTAEQLYDSLIIATEAHKSGRSSWDEAEKQRQEWLQQFVIAFGNDEGEEATTFNGTIPQALMMMNGELVSKATSAESGSFLNTVLTKEKNPSNAIRRLYLAALGRGPARRELPAAQKLISASGTPLAGYQDLFWALLN